MPPGTRPSPAHAARPCATATRRSPGTAPTSASTSAPAPDARRRRARPARRGRHSYVVRPARARHDPVRHVQLVGCPAQVVHEVGHRRAQFDARRHPDRGPRHTHRDRRPHARAGKALGIPLGAPGPQPFRGRTHPFSVAHRRMAVAATHRNLRRRDAPESSRSAAGRCGVSGGAPKRSAAGRRSPSGRVRLI